MRTVLIRLSLLAIIAMALAPAMAQDDIRPTRIERLEMNKTPDVSIDLFWPAVDSDVTGQEETIDHYKVYRGDLPTFIPDKSGGSNLIGTTTTESFSDPVPMTNDNPYFYIVTAVDTGGNEANAKPSVIETLPQLSVSDLPEKPRHIPTAVETQRSSQFSICRCRSGEAFSRTLEGLIAFSAW